MANNDEDILAAGEARPEEKRIRTMQEDLERAKEHVLPDLPLATPPTYEGPAPELPVPQVTAEEMPLAEPPEPAGPPPPELPVVPAAAEPQEPQVPTAVPVAGEDILEKEGEQPQMPQQEEGPSALSAEERLSYGQETEEGAVPSPPPQKEELPVLKPEELLSFGEEALPAAKGARLAGISKKLPLKFIALGLGAVLILGIGAFAASQFLFKGERVEQPPAEQPPLTTEPPTTPPAETLPEPTVPSPLLSINDTTTLVATNSRDVAATARRALTVSASENTVHRVLIKLETATERRFLSATETLEALGGALPLSVKQHLAQEESMFFVVNQSGRIRTGIAVRTGDAQALRATLLSWESNASQDFDQLLVELGKTQGPATPAFQNHTRGGIAIRFLNFPDPTITIDYAVAASQNLFLLTTSRESMFAAIDALP